MNVPQPQQQQQIQLEHQPLEVLYKLFRQRINLAEQIQRDLEGAKRDIALINAFIQKKEEAEQIKKQETERLKKEVPEEKPKEPEKKESKPAKKVIKKKGK